jgi:hypothetical protein
VLNAKLTLSFERVILVEELTLHRPFGLLEGPLRLGLGRGRELPGLVGLRVHLPDLTVLPREGLLGASDALLVALDRFTQALDFLVDGSNFLADVLLGGAAGACERDCGEGDYRCGSR